MPRDIAQWCAGKNCESDPKRQLARIRFGIAELAVIARKRVAQPSVIRWRVELHTLRQRAFDFLQQNDVCVVTLNFRQGGLQSNRGAVRIRVVPNLAELHVELENAESVHQQRSSAVTFRPWHRRPPESPDCHSRRRMARWGSCGKQIGLSSPSSRR